MPSYPALFLVFFPVFFKSAWQGKIVNGISQPTGSELPSDGLSDVAASLANWSINSVPLRFWDGPAWSAGLFQWQRTRLPPAGKARGVPGNPPG